MRILSASRSLCMSASATRSLSLVVPPRMSVARVMTRGLCSAKSSTMSTEMARELNVAVSIKQMAREQNVRLTENEMSALTRQLDESGDGMISPAELEEAGRQKLEATWRKEVLLSAIEKPQTALDRLGAWMIDVLDYAGTALFASVGVQIAGGEAGMNLVGCCLVGCAAAMGGGTVNNLLQGNARDGVFWVRSPSFLAVALGASVLTFFAWPRYCEWAAAAELEGALEEEHIPITSKHTLTREGFKSFVRNNPTFAARACKVLGVSPDSSTSADELFTLVDRDGSGDVELNELSRIVQMEFDASNVVYAFDTFALAAISIVAANGAVSRGLHPLVVCTAGVTICFGGLIRDVMCGRNLAIGGQSYALATGAGATVFVALRELAIRGVALPLALRLVLAGGTVVGLRTLEKVRGSPLLQPMHAQVSSHP